MTEALAAAELDMQWHVLPADAPLQDPDEFEKQALAKTHLDLHAVPPRYRSSYFSHIWAGGYSAGYYAYLWTQMLDDDAYQWFDEHGGLSRANGDRFRRMILSRGNTQDLAAMYAAWRGRAAHYRRHDEVSRPESMKTSTCGGALLLCALIGGSARADLAPDLGRGPYVGNAGGARIEALGVGERLRVSAHGGRHGVPDRRRLRTIFGNAQHRIRLRTRQSVPRRQGHLFTGNLFRARHARQANRCRHPVRCRALWRQPAKLPSRRSARPTCR